MNTLLPMSMCVCIDMYTAVTHTSLTCELKPVSPGIHVAEVCLVLPSQRVQ